MKAVVLAGGERRERFLLSVLGKRVVEYPLTALSSRFPTTLLTSGWTLDGYEVIFQKRDGILGAIEDAVEALGLPLIVAYGDVVAKDDFFLSISKPCSVVAVPFIPKERHSSIDEESTFIFAGLLSLDDYCFSKLLEEGSLLSAMRKLIKNGEMDVVKYSDIWFDIDKPEDVLLAAPRLVEEFTKVGNVLPPLPPTVVIKGNVIIEKGAEISDYVVLEGPAFVGKGAKVGPFTYMKNAFVERGAVVGSHSALIDVSVQPERELTPHSYVRGKVVT